MCPGHLVEKWKREIEETIPDAAVTIIGDWKAVMEIARTELGTKPDRPSYYVISRDRAKLSYFRRPATVTRRGQHACPDCFKPVLDREGIESLVLSSKVKPDDREAWLREKAADGAKVSAKKPKVAKPEAEPRVNHVGPFVTRTRRPAASPKKTAGRKRSRRAARIVALPAFG